ncbi:CHAD domain-containing protein [Flocculibacter collagenilyticus]|uniref:CHAD domain-containing protein n=1 Tax=Flocculibacter collagenilyticus TaxID=2744479 RepID=UPI0018F4E04D|nr:CHAD domain-containing protein [Flocculibacter collagenilyticus]
MSEIKTWKLISLFCLLSLLLGCDSKEERTQQTIKLLHEEATLEVNALGNALDKKQIHNAKLLTEYGKTLSQQNPQLSEIAKVITQDATKQGPLYQNLLSRLSDLKTPSPEMPSEEVIRQIELVKSAAKISVFADALTDPINVLADLSNGTLPRVGAISEAAETAANSATDIGNQLVGNPNYGEWQTSSSGISFWQWYAMYRIFDDIFDRIEYGRWSKRRKYSYYNDYGRSRYTSYKQYKHQNKIENRTRQSYKSQGKQFTSPYAKTKTGASGLSRSSHTPPAVRSSYSKASNYSKSSSGSVRNSSSRTSRGISRGK